MIYKSLGGIILYRSQVLIKKSLISLPAIAILSFFFFFLFGQLVLLKEHTSCYINRCVSLLHCNCHADHANLRGVSLLRGIYWRDVLCLEKPVFWDFSMRMNSSVIKEIKELRRPVPDNTCNNQLNELKRVGASTLNSFV